MTNSGLSILVAHKAGQSGVDLEQAIGSFGHATTAVADLASMLKRLAQCHHAILMIDSELLPPDPSLILGDIACRHTDLAVVVLASDPSLKSVVAALRGGACDYLAKPFQLDQLDRCIQRAVVAHIRFSQRVQTEVVTVE